MDMTTVAIALLSILATYGGVILGYFLEEKRRNHAIDRERLQKRVRDLEDQLDQKQTAIMRQLETVSATVLQAAPRYQQPPQWR